ncbi:MAG TPA: AAA family ATPase [Devosiaceae bacterium]|jgi:uncharacterized protein YhaN|nr:AAA family ATPase [Devosiaceae bacterium]
MRLRRLDLTRYGKFTDKSIDFGSTPSDNPDLHIVFGLNEAGKSTALSGFLDLLFGIEERSHYNFLHEYGSMRVGGVLELDGQEHVFTRTKQRSNSLLDANGQPVGELVISAHLAGLGRGDYGSMFSLDDETLENGGEAILQSKGDLGRLLFTASAGLSNASETLLALEAEADGLYRKHSHSTELAVLKKRLMDLKAEREAVDTLASKFEALESERQDATEKHDRAVADRSIMLARLESIDRLSRGIPMLAEHRRKCARLADMPSMSSPPRTWTGSVAQMMVDDAGISARIAANSAELERLEKRQAEIQIDDAILAVSERTRSLIDRKARHVSAGLDLPARRTELRILDNAVADALAALGRTGHADPRSLLLPAATTSIVRGMFDQRTGLAVATGTARDELAAAVEALDAARQRVGEERAVPASSRARLEAARSKAQESGIAQERRRAVQLLEENTALLRVAVLRLHPWSGTGEALAALQVPSPRQVSGWRALLGKHEAEVSGLKSGLQEHRLTRDATAQHLEALKARVAVPDDEVASKTRAARNSAWAAHREGLEAETADAFASILAEDDAVGASRLANARELEELRTTTVALAGAESSIQAMQQNLVRLDAILADLLEEMRASIAGLGRLPDGTVSADELIDAIEDLIAVRANALEVFARIEAASSTLERLAAEEGRLRADLVSALGRVGLAAEKSDGIEALLGVVESFLERQSKLDAEHAEALLTVRTREEELAARRRALETAQRREEEWLEGITGALAGTWLESGLPAAAVGGVLDQLSTLAKVVQDRDALKLRIDKMEADRSAFLAEVASLAEACSQPMNHAEPEQAAAALAERLEAAERARENAIVLARDHRIIMDARDSLIAEQTMILASKTEVLRAFAVETLEEVVEREEALKERDRLRESIAELEERMALELRVDAMPPAEAMLDGVDADALMIEKLELEQRLENIGEALKELLVRQTRASDKIDAIGSDSAVARIDAQRRTTLLEMEEKAARYIQLRLGIMAAGNALRVYRDQHRSAMMTKASEAFALMTRGQYSGLTTQPAKNGEVLIAMQSDGSSKMADALSKGARFQLYLALRLAGYYEFAQVRSPVPFIADDIMETFDHVRSEEVFRLFGEMSKTGQVIYLTHHSHLCEIARQVVPGVKVHELT